MFNLYIKEISSKILFSNHKMYSKNWIFPYHYWILLDISGSRSITFIGYKIDQMLKYFTGSKTIGIFTALWD